MLPGLATLAPLFVGPSVFLVGTLLVIVLILAIVRVVIGTIILGVLWLLGAIGVGPPGIG